MIKKKNIYSLVQYLFIVFVILDCNSVYRAAYENYFIPEICSGLAILLLLTHGIIYGLNRNVFKKCAITLMTYFIVVVVYMIVGVSADALFTYVIRYFLILPIIIYVVALDIHRNEDNSLFYKISDVMYFLAISSLLLWLLGIQMKLIEPNMSIEAYWGGIYTYPGYFGLLFERQYTEFLGKIIYRNQSIFAEGPMYSLCLIIALGIELFLKNDESAEVKAAKNKYVISKKSLKRNLRIFVLTAAIISTFTTTGWIFVVALYTIKYMMKQNVRKKYDMIFKIIFSIILLIIAVYAITYFINEKTGSNSWNTRMNDYVVGFVAWKSSPIYGTGYGDYLKAASVSGIVKQGFSNSVMAILSQGGIMLFSIYIIPVINIIFNSLKKRDYNKLMFVVLILAELILTLFPYTFLLLIILAVYYAQHIMRSEEKDNNQLLENAK